MRSYSKGDGRTLRLGAGEMTVPLLLAKLSENLGPAMVGINADEIETIMEERGK